MTHDMLTSSRGASSFSPATSRRRRLARHGLTRTPDHRCDLLGARPWAHRRYTCRWLVCSAAALTICWASCDRSTTPSARTPVNASYVELVSLAPKPDESHSDPVTSVDGTVWYRERQSGLNLAQCNHERAVLAPTPDGTWAIVLPVRGALNQDALQEWSRQRLGGDVGVMLNGHLVVVAKLKSRLLKQILIAAFATKAEASAELARIHAGGSPCGE
jgi:hypothetical protein